MVKNEFESDFGFSDSAATFRFHGQVLEPDMILRILQIKKGEYRAYDRKKPCLKSYFSDFTPSLFIFGPCPYSVMKLILMMDWYVTDTFH